jgi:DHA1 family bicyclomycin/chloramphenicol resistance-like MFS transporter
MLGGWMLVFFSWHAIFLLLSAIGALCLVLVALRLPETRDPAHIRPLGLAPVVTGYWRLLRHRSFLGHALTGGTMMAGTFAYIAGSPFVVISLYGVPREDFGWVFGGNALGFIIASQVNVRLQRRFSPERVLLGALLFQIAAAVFLVACGWSGFGGLWGVLVPLFFWISTMGFVVPNTTALAMAPFAANAGAASALLGVLQFVLASASAALVGLAGALDQSARPMTGVMACFSLCSLSINRFVAKRPAP